MTFSIASEISSTNNYESRVVSLLETKYASVSGFNCHLEFPRVT